MLTLIKARLSLARQFGYRPKRAVGGAVDVPGADARVSGADSRSTRIETMIASAAALRSRTHAASTVLPDVGADVRTETRRGIGYQLVVSNVAEANEQEQEPPSSPAQTALNGRAFSESEIWCGFVRCRRHARQHQPWRAFHLARPHVAAPLLAL
ncbi:MAG TPA: hypothetical protein VGJ75_17210 [Dongiaceae bacterium]|jgi:hypothetical protein